MLTLHSRNWRERCLVTQELAKRLDGMFQLVPCCEWNLWIRIRVAMLMSLLASFSVKAVYQVSLFTVTAKYLIYIEMTHVLSESSILVYLRSTCSVKYLDRTVFQSVNACWWLIKGNWQEVARDDYCCTCNVEALPANYCVAPVCQAH